MRFLTLFLLFSIVLFLLISGGCSSSVQINEENTSSQTEAEMLELREEYAQRWEPSGHKYTTYIVARIAGHDIDRSHKLAYFTQMPDIDGELKAIDGVWGVLLALTSKKMQIKDILHSLHGGNRADVVKRRVAISSMIQDRVGSQTSDWEVGILIHAYGDSYSHTNRDGEAYPPGIGHGLEGHRPDEIVRNWNKYETYARALFRALLNQDNANSRESLEQFLVKSQGEIIVESRQEESVMKQIAIDLGFNETSYLDARGDVTPDEVLGFMLEMERYFSEFQYNF